MIVVLAGLSSSTPPAYPLWTGRKKECLSEESGREGDRREPGPLTLVKFASWGISCPSCSPGSSSALWARHSGEAPDLPGQEAGGPHHSQAREVCKICADVVEGAQCPEGSVASAALWGGVYQHCYIPG